MCADTAAPPSDAPDYRDTVFLPETEFPMRAGLPQDRHPEIEQLRDRFLDYYEQNICVHSRLYPGAVELFARLNEQGIAWGIVTNKPIALARKLTAALKLQHAAMLGGDSLALKKPDPAPLLAACQQLGVAPKNTWMVGDDPRDIQAGQRAGCPVTIACAFGYLGDSLPIQQWGASWIANSLDELRL